jgi:hypothetical protein
VPVLFLLLLPGLTFSPDLSLAYQGETGVEARGLVTAGLVAGIGRLISLDAALSFGFIQHPGLGTAALSATLAHPGVPGLDLMLGFQHQQWNDWHIGEDRLFSLARYQPLRLLKLGLGICRRLPFSTAGERRQLLFPEWNLLYHLCWQLLRTDRLTLNAELSNYDRLEIKNPQQLPLAISTVYYPGKHWEILSRCRLGFNGISTGLPSLTSMKMEIGVCYGR